MLLHRRLSRLVSIARANRLLFSGREDDPGGSLGAVPRAVPGRDRVLTPAAVAVSLPLLPGAMYHAASSPCEIRDMPAIRIPRQHWGKVWSALVASGPISRLTHDLIYYVSDRQVRLLRRRKLPFELVDLPNGPRAGKRHG
jgi:hypothetical protein